MFVAASTECFPDLSPQEALEVIADLQFTAVELPIHESGRGLKPSEVHSDLERSVRFCRDTHRLDIAAGSVRREQHTHVCILSQVRSRSGRP